MSRSSAEIEELIANGRRLAQEANDVLAAAEKFFAEHDITPESALERVRELGGDEAVAEVLAKVQEEIEQVNGAVLQQQIHGVKPRPAGRRVVTRSMI